MTMRHSYHRSKDRAEAVASLIGGTVNEGNHPDSEYKGVKVWWVIE
jgi:hypothetical protein